MSTIGIWTDLEGHVGLWAASSPALQPLIRTVSFRLGFRSRLQSYGQKGQYNTGAGGGRPSFGAWPSQPKSKTRYAGGGDVVKAADGNSERGLVSSDGDNDEDVEVDSLKPGSSASRKEVGVEFRADKTKARDERSTRPSTRGSRSLVSL